MTRQVSTTGLVTRLQV